MSYSNMTNEGILSEKLDIAYSKINHFERERDELRAEVEGLKADKARKKWLIEKADIHFFKELSDYEKQADEAIDAAMKGAE